MWECDLSGIWFTGERERKYLLWPWATERSARPQSRILSWASLRFAHMLWFELWFDQINCPCDVIQMSHAASLRFWSINIISNIYRTLHIVLSRNYFAINYRYQIIAQPRACERSWAVRISAPRSRGCSLPRSTAQCRTRSLRSHSSTISSRSGEIAPRSLKFKITLHA